MDDETPVVGAAWPRNSKARPRDAVEQSGGPLGLRLEPGRLEDDIACAERLALPAGEPDRLPAATELRKYALGQLLGAGSWHLTPCLLAGVHGSRTHPRPLVRPRNRFEDGGSHRAPSTPAPEGTSLDAYRASGSPAVLSRLWRESKRTVIFLGHWIHGNGPSGPRTRATSALRLQ